MNNIKPIAFSFIVSLSIAFVFLMATFWILAYSGPTSLKDSLDTTGTYFGAVSTLGAAIIAAHLFNDWRETQTAQNRAEHAKSVKKSLITLKSHMDFYRNQALEYSKKIKPEERKYCKELKEDFLKKYHQLFIDLKINVDIYENTYKDTLLDNIDGPHLKAYFLCIEIAFNRVIHMNDEYPNVEVAQTLSDIEKFHNSFHQDFFLPILNKLNPHINLVG